MQLPPRICIKMQINGFKEPARSELGPKLTTPFRISCEFTVNWEPIKDCVRSKAARIRDLVRPFQLNVSRIAARACGCDDEINVSTRANSSCGFAIGVLVSGGGADGSTIGAESRNCLCVIARTRL